MQRGSIVIANLEPVKGSEQGGIRPCLLIQNDIGNQYSPTVIIAAITSRDLSRNIPTNVSLSKKESGLEKDSVVMLSQIRTIDKSRIIKKVSSLNIELMKKVDSALRVSLDI